MHTLKFNLRWCMCTFVWVREFVNRTRALETQDSRQRIKQQSIPCRVRASSARAHLYAATKGKKLSRREAVALRGSLVVYACGLHPRNWIVIIINSTQNESRISLQNAEAEISVVVHSIERNIWNIINVRLGWCGKYLFKKCIYKLYNQNNFLTKYFWRFVQKLIHIKWL